MTVPACGGTRQTEAGRQETQVWLLFVVKLERGWGAAAETSDSGHHGQALVELALRPWPS